MSGSKSNQTLLVQVDADAAGGVAESSQKLVRLARTLTTGEVVALALDPAAADVRALADDGADRVLLAEARGLSSRVPGQVAEAVLAAIEVVAPGAILLSSTYVGRAAAAMVAVKSGSAAFGDVAEVTAQGEGLAGAKSALGGEWRTTFEAVRGVPVFAVRPGVGPDEAVGSGGASGIEALAFELTGAPARVEVVSSRQQAAGGRIGLGEADIAVVAGRGIDGDISLVEDLADELGAAVGATRVVCDEGWLPRAAQIGQTGVSISPKLYIGLGVSGAVHHTCGMLASERIVAVVDDPDAPILELADFAVVGDVNDVVPQALEALRGRD